MIEAWNTLINYLAAQEPLEGKYDLAILAGNSLPFLADELATLHRTKRVNKVMLVGGRGHATPFLRENLQKMGLFIPDASEAEMYRSYLAQRYALPDSAILMEKQSTNSGENAMAALGVIKETQEIPQRVLLLQDPLLQRRLKAAFLRAWQHTDTKFTNYVPRIPLVESANKSLKFKEQLFQQAWSDAYFLSLALGEVPRLRNDEMGYGPKGKNFIDAIEIPLDVEKAYAKLIRHYGSQVLR